jgi:hypothetical protein
MLGVIYAVTNKYFMLSAIMLNVVMLNVVMLNVVMLSIMAPFIVLLYGTGGGGQCGI